MSLASILSRTVVAIWLMTSAFSRYAATQLKIPEMVIRFALVVVMLVAHPAIHWTGFAIGVLVIGCNNLVVGRRQAADTGPASKKTRPGGMPDRAITSRALRR